MLSRIPLVQVRSVTVIVSLLVMWMLAGCASEPIQQQVVMSEPVNDARPHRLKIVNHSSDVMNVILYKPCGSKVDLFQPLAENLKPKQGVVFNVFNECIDVRATNTFDQTLAEKEALSLTTADTWTIESKPAPAKNSQ